MKASTPLERYVVERWQEVLDVERVGVDDNFFELGGDSVRAATFVNQLQTALGQVVSMATIFEVPTIAGLSAHLERLHPDAVARLSAERPEASDVTAGTTDPDDSNPRVGPVAPPMALGSDDFDEGSL